MIVSKKVSLNTVSWLNYYPENSCVNILYEPENLDELVSLCIELYGAGKHFELIGHATNTYFLPGYNIDILISTKRLRTFNIVDNKIICECGVNVSYLSRNMIELGYSGFEGLINLPGTIGAAVYGNSSCYHCSIISLVDSFTLIDTDGNIRTLDSDWLKASHRSTCLKRKEAFGVILGVTLKAIPSDVNYLKSIAESNQIDRRTTQPAPNNNLGSIFVSSSNLTFYGFCVKVIVGIYSCVLALLIDKQELPRKKKLFELWMLNALDLEKYIHSWNRYIWSDEYSHQYFSKYVKVHNKIFRKTDFEIEIKGK